VIDINLLQHQIDIRIVSGIAALSRQERSLEMKASSFNAIAAD